MTRRRLALPSFPEKSLFDFASEVSKMLETNDPLRIQKRTLVTGRSDLSRNLLRGKMGVCNESAFYRIGETALPLDLQAEINSRIVRLLKSAKIDQDSITRSIEAIPLGVGLESCTWGVRVIHAVLAPLLGPISGPLQKLISDYIATSIIPDDLRGRRFFRYRSVPRIRRAFAEELISLTLTDETLARIVVESCSRESLAVIGELYQRLVLSFVGFTGVALEWSVISLIKNPLKGESEATHNEYVKEVLRLYGPAWRLLRTASMDSSFGGIRISSGDSIWISLHHLHREPSYWHNPLEFDSTRWLAGSHSSHFFPFGYGVHTCPAAAFVPKLLSDLLCVIGQTREFCLVDRVGSQPLVLTLFAPGDHRIVFARKAVP